MSVLAVGILVTAAWTSGHTVVRAAVGAAPSQITFANSQGDIVALAVRSGSRKVIVRHKHGNPALEFYDPAWSRHGHLAVTQVETPTEGHGYSLVYVVRPRRQIVPGFHSDFSEMPSWAPDGRQIVFVGIDIGDPYRVGGLVISTPGARPYQNLTPGGDANLDRAPAWSPDGSLIAFARSKTGFSPLRLYVIQPDGTHLRRLTSTFADNPSWAPDSSRIVFDDGRRIAVIGADGHNFKYLTQGPGDSNPAWSPDGKTIAFVRRGDLWVVNAAGRNARRLTRQATDPAWMHP